MLDCTIDDSGRIIIRLTSPPAWCTGIVLHLPDGQHTYDFTDPQSPIPNPPISTPPQNLLKQFLDHLEVNEDRSPNTLKGYRVRLGQFLAWLHHRNQSLADPESWLAYYANLKRRKPELSPYTIKGHYHILNRFGRWLAENNHLPAHPLAMVQAPGLPKDLEPKAITAEHIDKMLQITHSPRDRALLLFFRDTGCRATEAVQLTWGKLKLDEGKTEVLGKGNKGRQLFFKLATRRALEKYRQSLKHTRPDDPVWQGRQGQLSYNGLYKIFKRLAAEAGLDDDTFSPHAWRHAFGRDTTIAGIPTAQLQELMGHSSIETTKIYARFNTLELQQAHDRYSPVDGDLTLDADEVK